jgi:hypothetical protein
LMMQVPEPQQRVSSMVGLSWDIVIRKAYPVVAVASWQRAIPRPAAGLTLRPSNQTPAFPR